MKLLSASDAKKGRLALENKVPRAGTRTRELYDMFMHSRGLPVAYSKNSNTDAPLLAQLTDRYGLDIRNLDRGTWALAGEWFGKHYVDYIAAVVDGESA